MGCNKCNKLCENAKTVCMKGSGPTKGVEIMLIGEAPGAEEDEQGVPFIGRAGKFMRKNLMAPLGMEGNEVFITNAVRCRPPANRVPRRREIVNCRENLVREIREIRPKVILLLGNSALCSILFLEKVQGITRWNGKLLWSIEFGCWVIPTFHPSALMRDRSMGIDWRFDTALEAFQLAQQVTHRKAPEQPRVKKLIITSVTGLLAYLRATMNASDSNMKVSVDLETDLFDPRNDILGVSMCFKGREGIYYPMYTAWETMLEANDYGKKLFNRILYSDKIIKPFHNVAFDKRFLWFHRFKIRNAQDTMIAAHLLDENFSVGLKQRTWIDLTFGGYDIALEKYKIEHKFTKNTSYKEIPFDTLAGYAAFDALATYMLWEKYEVRLKEEGLLPLYQKISMPVREVMTEAEINGIRVDMDSAESLSKRMTKAKEVLEEKILKEARKDINFMSTKQLSHLLFEELRAPDSGRTQKGNLKCDKAALTKVARGDPKRRATKIAQTVLKYKYMDKLQGTYIGQVNKFVWDDGRVHSNYNLAGTVTGRTSNSQPCTHNIPKDQLIRSLYIASPGCKIVEADLKGAEMVAMAAVSKDQVLTEIIESGADLHNRTFIEIFDKSDDYIPTQDERRVGKMINFGVIYGITATGLAKRLKIAVTTAQKYIDMYFSRFVGVAEWIHKIRFEAKRNGYVVSLFNRKRRLPDIQRDDKWPKLEAERQAINSLVQSAAADYTYIGLIRTSKLLKKYQLNAKVVHTVHDCILVDTPEEEIDQVKQIIKYAFEKRVKAFPLPMKVDIEVSNSWGEHNESNLEVMLKEMGV